MLGLWKRSSGSVRVPTVLQAQATECGVAALGMLLAYYGRHVPLEELRQVTGVSRDGSNAKIMIRAAQEYGVRLRATLTEPHELPACGLPLIAHLNFGHFVVVESMTADRVRFNDPSRGRTEMPLDEFDLAYTGVALVGSVIQPDTNPKRERGSVTAPLAGRLAGYEWPLAAALVSGCVSAVAAIGAILLLARCVDAIVAGQAAAGVWIWGMAVAASVSGLAAWCERFSLARLEKRLAWTEVCRLLRHIIRLPHSFFAYRLPGCLHGTVRSSNELAAQVSEIASVLVGVAAAPCFVAGMFWYDPIIGSLILVAGLVNAAAIHLIRQRAELLASSGSAGSRAAGYAASTIERIEVLKTGGMDTEFLANVSGDHAYGVSRQQRRARIDQYEHLITAAVDDLTMLVVLVLGAVSWLAGRTTIGAIVALVLLSARLLDSLRGAGGLAVSFRRLRDVRAGLEDVLGIRPDDPSSPHAPREAFSFNGEPQATALVGIAASDNSHTSGNPLACGSPLNEASNRAITLTNVTFGYSHARPARIHDVSLCVRPGILLGITGASASGKSTLAGLMVGVHRPWSGTVELGGRPLESIPRDELARTVAWIDKTPFLFEGTVRENLCLWDDGVSDDTLRQAVRDACLDDVLWQRGEGLDSLVVERGLNFSGGQRQRLEIARALARNPAIVILDEANDALEVNLERQIIANLRRRGCTVVVITHRAQTLSECDEIIVVEDGRIVQQDARRVPAAPVCKPDAQARENGEEGFARASGLHVRLNEAFARVAESLGVRVDRDDSELASGQLAIYELARRAGLVVRRIRLIDRHWWQNDDGSLIGFLDENEQPVSLLPACGGGYAMFDPGNGTSDRVTAGVASRLSRTAYMLYRRLPDGPIRPKDVLRFGASRCGEDALLALAAGLVLALLAAAWPVAGTLLFSSSLDSTRVGLVAALGLLAVCCALFRRVEHFTRLRLFARGEHEAITAFWDRVVRLPVQFFRRERAEKLGQVANSVSGLYAMLGSAAHESLLAVPALAFLGVLCWLSVPLALAGLALALPMVLVPALVTWPIRRLEQPRFECAVRASTFLFDVLRGMRRLRSAGGPLRAVERWERFSQQENAVNWRMRRLTHLREAFLHAYPLLAIAGFAGVASTGLAGDLAPGQWLAALLAVAGLIAATKSLSAAWTMWMLARPLSQRIEPILAEPCEAEQIRNQEEVGRGQEAVARPLVGRQPSPPQGRKLPDNSRTKTTAPAITSILRGEIELDRVTFRYSDRAAPAVENVSIRIEPGQVVAIAGPSGSGKSTLLRVILGYCLPQHGSVRFDGVAMGRWNLDMLRVQIGAVLQEDSLWDGILRNNIACMAPFSLDEVWEALRVVELADDVSRMPRKVNTFAAEATLSTGQKQRLVMARQVIRRPRLLVLDEATSALDEPTEARLFANLRRLPLTCVVVANRQSTLAHADRMYVLRDGRVVADDLPAACHSEIRNSNFARNA